MLSPTHFGASVTSSDNAVALNAWLAALARTHDVGIVDGLYRFAAPLAAANCPHLRIEQPLAPIDPGSLPYGLQWTGSPNPTATALTLTNVGKVELSRVSIHGGNAVGTLIEVLPQAGAYQHEGIVLRDVMDGGICYSIGGSVLCNQFRWQDCNLAPNAKGTSLKVDNPNSADHEFIGGVLGGGITGANLKWGKIAFRGTEFANNAGCDVLCGVAQVVLDNCWSEDSGRVLEYLQHGGWAAVDVRSCNFASSPFNYWKHYGGPTPDFNDPATFAAMIVNPPNGFSISNTFLQAPYFQDPQFKLQTVLCQDAGAVLDWDSRNAFSCLPGQTVNYTKRFFSVQ